MECMMGKRNAYVFWSAFKCYMVDEKGAKSMLVCSTGNEKSTVTVLLTDYAKLPPYVFIKRKTIPIW